MKLQWHDIETFKTDRGKSATKLFVSGRNKERSLVARDEATHYVFSINERITKWRHGSVPFIDVLSGPVFVMPDALPNYSSSFGRRSVRHTSLP